MPCLANHCENAQHCSPGTSILRLFRAVINYIMSKASAFVKAKKVADNDKYTSLLHYGKVLKGRLTNQAIYILLIK